jgi:hypothetical protein
MRRQPLHRVPGIVADVRFRERARREPQRDREHDRRREAANRHEDGLDTTGASAAHPGGQRPQPDRGQQPDRHIERIEQPALDVREVGKVEQRDDERRPDQHQCQSAITAAPGDDETEDGQQQRQPQADGKADRARGLVSPLARPLGDGGVAEEDPGVVDEERASG